MGFASAECEEKNHRYFGCGVVIAGWVVMLLDENGNIGKEAHLKGEAKNSDPDRTHLRRPFNSGGYELSSRERSRLGI